MYGSAPPRDSRQPVPTASDHAFVANVKVTSPSPGFSLEYARVNVQLRHPSATTNYVVFISVRSSGWHSRANLCQHKVGEWSFAYQNLSQKLFGYPLSIYMLKTDLQWRYITTLFIAAVQHLSGLNKFWQFWPHIHKMFKVKSLFRMS